jgi:hypothetical protein
MTPEELDALFPDRHDEAERLGIHPSLRAYFVPLVAGGFTEAQSDALFPGWHRAMKSITEIVWQSTDEEQPQ